MHWRDVVFDDESTLPMAVPEGPLNVHAILQEAVDALGGGPFDRSSETDAMCRLRAISIPIAKFVTKIRIVERFLSQAQINGGGNLVVGSHNWLQHEVAKANYIHNISTVRMSNAALWHRYTVKHDQILRSGHPGLAGQVPDTFRPSCCLKEDGERDYRVCAFGRPSSHAVDMGVVMEVFRGAVVKPKAKANAKVV